MAKIEILITPLLYSYSVVTFKASLKFILSETFDQMMKPLMKPVSLAR